MRHAECECSDPGCDGHPGLAGCTRRATERLYRIDMEDVGGLLMCEECADDAMESGVFTDDYAEVLR